MAQPPNDDPNDPGDDVEPEAVGMEPELERIEELEGDEDRIETENGIV